MVRQTSIKVYRRIEAEGLLPKMRLAVYRVLFHYGPLTRAEIVEHLVDSENVKYPYVYNRLSELRMQKAVDVVGTRICRVTGNECQIWDVTDRIPEKLPRKVPKVKILEEENRSLRREVARLKMTLYRRTARRRPS